MSKNLQMREALTRAGFKVFLPIPKIGRNQLNVIREQISNYVVENFSALYVGAEKLGCSIEEDYYTTRRIQINNTRLNPSIGLKYTDGIKYSENLYSETNLFQSIRDIQALIKACEEEVTCTFKVVFECTR